MRTRYAVVLAVLAPVTFAGSPGLVRVLDTAAPETIDTVGFNDWGTGGLSGIEYVRGSLPENPWDPRLTPRTQAPGQMLPHAEFLVVSDDRAEFDPCRLGTLTITFDLDGVKLDAVGPIHWTTLTDEHGSRFATDHADPEGIRAAPGTELVYWSSEGRTKESEPPAVFELDQSGVTTRLTVPVAFIPDSPDKQTQAFGVRNNRGFEALAYEAFPLPGRSNVLARRLYAAVEEPLAQDESDDHRVCRVLVYEPDVSRLEGPTRAPMIPTRELLYPLGPVPEAWADADNGLSEMICVGPARMLSLERAERVIDGIPHYNIRLYWVSTEGAADVLGHEGFGPTPAADLPPTMMKKLLLDFDDIAGQLPGGRPMNFEGLALLPGNRLLVVSDNDHGAEGPTVFVLLQLPDNLDK